MVKNMNKNYLLFTILVLSVFLLGADDNKLSERYMDIYGDGGGRILYELENYTTGETDGAYHSGPLGNYCRNLDVQCSTTYSQNLSSNAFKKYPRINIEVGDFRTDFPDDPHFDDDHYRSIQIKYADEGFISDYRNYLTFMYEVNGYTDNEFYIKVYVDPFEEIELGPFGPGVVKLDSRDIYPDKPPLMRSNYEDSEPTFKIFVHVRFIQPYGSSEQNKLSFYFKVLPGNRDLLKMYGY